MKLLKYWKLKQYMDSQIGVYSKQKGLLLHLYAAQSPLICGPDDCVKLYEHRGLASETYTCFASSSFSSQLLLDLGLLESLGLLGTRPSPCAFILSIAC